eukprot:6968613-Heterocapsa_arctica.AAC.1
MRLEGGCWRTPAGAPSCIQTSTWSSGSPPRAEKSEARMSGGPSTERCEDRLPHDHELRVRGATPRCLRAIAPRHRLRRFGDVAKRASRFARTARPTIAARGMK